MRKSRSLELTNDAICYLSTESRDKNIISLLKWNKKFIHDTLSQHKIMLQNNCNSEAREWRHDSDKTQIYKLEWWMIFKIPLRAKAGVPKTLVKQKLRLHSLYFPQNTLCWLSLAENSVICILFLDFARFAIEKNYFSLFKNLSN